MRKSHFIIITGPECSGKSTLSATLAEKYEFPLKKEVARWYLPGLGRPYIYPDLIDISQMEARRLLDYRFSRSPIVIADTWLIVMRIWMEVKYGACPSWIKETPKIYGEATYLLCAPDIPWTYDPLRENPDNRWELYEKYLKVLNASGLNYAVIQGKDTERVKIASRKVLQALPTR